MAIEDEIINISDIDVGTEILNNDKLIIETNNGTKLISFKDFVIGEENITFKDKLVQGARTGKTSTETDIVTGYNILTTDTVAGHLTKYSDISGTVELGRFNYVGVSEFASLSTTITTNETRIGDVEKAIARVESTLKNTDSDALNSITLTTKSVNFVVTQTGNGGTGTTEFSFSTRTLDPVLTNPNVVFASSPFKITYPSDSSYVDGFIQFQFDGTVSTTSTTTPTKYADLILLLDGVEVGSTQFIGTGADLKGKHQAQLSKVVYVKKGQTIRLTTSNALILNDGATFFGVKIAS